MNIAVHTDCSAVMRASPAQGMPTVAGAVAPARQRAGNREAYRGASSHALAEPLARRPRRDASGVRPKNKKMA